MRPPFCQYFNSILLICTFLSITWCSHAQNPGPIGPYLNGVFPTTTPGAAGAWDVVEFVPNNAMPSPIKIIDIPNENEVFVLCKGGQIWKLNLENKTHYRVLDISDRCLNLGEGGSTGMALHPKFDSGVKEAYVYYRYVPNLEGFNKGFNRLSRFTWDNIMDEFDPDSEQVLFQQYDSHIWHNGGALFFDKEGYLYVTAGDEGASDEVDITFSTQRIDLGFFSGMLRIDVDNDTSRSHPIIRQPVSLNTPVFEGETTYSQGYSIPNDNPWQSPEGDLLEEFYAIGLRAPYSTFYDELNDEIWVADVGSNKFEELNLVKAKGNYQWPYAEGDQPSETYSKPDPLLGIEHPPYYFYNRQVGSSIVGGGIYRGPLFPSLDDKFLFADYVSKKIMVVNRDQVGDPDVLVGDVSASGIPLPDNPGIAGLSILKNGFVLIQVISGSDFEQPGAILQLVNQETVADPPAKLSEIGAFKDLESLEVQDGFIPYEVNSPLWSDRADKYRWIALPNDGTFDSKTEQIDFQSSNPFNFPEGTVFMKHFELSTDLSNPEESVRLETRFFVITEDNSAYGLTYKWNEEGDEAFLQQSRTQKEFEILDEDQTMFSQIWDYPSRSNCMRCHNAEAGFVLGFNTHQLNKTVNNPSTGVEINQLSFFNQLNAFNTSLLHHSAYAKSYALKDSSVPLGLRIRSYLDANCGFCHRPNGQVTTTDIDLRFQQNFGEEFLINQPTVSMASQHDLIVNPGDHNTSELWVRDATRNDNRMPPLASNLVDQSYIDSLAVWIDNITIDTLERADVSINPNPIESFVRIKVGNDYLPSYQVEIYDMQGIQRITHQLTGSTTFLNLSTLQSGAYILVVSSESFSRKTKILKL